MTLKQVSIFLENRAGRVADVLNTLKQSDINIYALNIADTAQFGILRLIVDNTEKAITTLKNEGFTASSNDVVGVSMQDKVGALADIIETLSHAGVDIEYLYAFAGRHKENPAVVVIKPSDIELALTTLDKSNYITISHKEI